MNVFGDAEFVLLYSPQNLHLPCDLYPHFDLQNLTEDECLSEFRFRKADIPRLSQALRIPDVINCHQGTINFVKELKFEAVVLPLPIQRHGPLVR